MTASIDRNLPATGAALSSAEMRAQFGAAANDIEALQADKQDALVSGTNLKTVNGTSLLGSGNVTISGGGAVDSVAGRTGDVVLVEDDIFDAIGYVPERGIYKNYPNGYAGLVGYTIRLNDATGLVSSAIASSATSGRTWTFPDKTGTVAMTSDVGSNVSNFTLDFGAWPGSNEATATITGQTAITTAHRPTASILAVASGSHTANDAAYAALFIALTCTEPVAATGYTIHARSPHKLTGTFAAAGQWS